MEHIKKLIPKKVPIAGNKLIVSEKSFNNLVDTINKITETINALIDAVETLDNTLTNEHQEKETLKNSITTLANALKTIMEE